MIKHRRHRRILEVVQTDGAADVSVRARLMPEVARVTLRRDIAELAEAGELKRPHGGAVLPDAAVLRGAHACPKIAPWPMPRRGACCAKGLAR